jgi:hypothetical protein
MGIETGRPRRGWSPLGLACVAIYLLVAARVRVNDMNSSPWMMKDFMSGLVALPGIVVLQTIGRVRPDEMTGPDYVIAILLTAPVVYLAALLFRAVLRRFTRND